MPITTQTLLLFALNLIDAALTIYWVKNGYATEGNHLMATLLDIGVFPFLAVKIAVGSVAAVTLWRWGNLKIAKYGLVATLVVYIGLMGVHIFTGLVSFGYISENVVTQLFVK